MVIEVGARAPRFALRDAHGRTIEGPDARGGRGVLVAFFPLAFTPVCTDELRALDDDVARFAAGGVSVVAVSVDSMATLRAFGDAHGLALPLLSDFWPHGAVASAYGVLLPDRGWADRVSVLVDATGVVRAVVRGTDERPRDAAAHDAALDALDADALDTAAPDRG
ncbi:redoxin domain-containing protein [Microcella alkalica]|uniref:redoxin domain-containing protein n=1 Tax=Microcella alkalica TaxID=355930 RepID=UPI00145CAA05|nr:redoxin domain-containing protein [Microcella alkalica]